MKKILLTLAFILLLPTSSYAVVTAGWVASSTSAGVIYPSRINGIEQSIRSTQYTATGTIPSLFPNASTTNLSATVLCLTGDTCRSTWPTGTAYPFISKTTFSTSTQATTTSISTQGVFFASSTVKASQFPYASTTAISAQTIYASSKIGINTTAPEQPLHVKGPVQIEGTPTPRLYFKSNDGNWFVIDRNSGQESYPGYFGENGDTGAMYFRGQGASYFGDQTMPAITAIGSTGKVGIKAVTSPTYDLQVGGTFSAQTSSGGATEYPGISSPFLAHGNVDPSSISGYFGGYADNLYDDGSGDLRAGSDDRQIGTINYSTGVIDTDSYFGDTIDEITYNYTGAVSIATLSNGYVGIGTETPTEVLDVHGNLHLFDPGHNAFNGFNFEANNGETGILRAPGATSAAIQFIAGTGSSGGYFGTRTSGGTNGTGVFFFNSTQLSQDVQFETNYANSYLGNNGSMNLNNTLYMPSGAGKVGVGTSSPSSIFSVGNTNGINFSTASTTFSSTGGINLKNGCFAINGTCISGGSSGATYPFTSLTNYGATNQATTGIAWFQNGINASSTSHFDSIGGSGTLTFPSITATDYLTVGNAGGVGYPVSSLVTFSTVTEAAGQFNFNRGHGLGGYALDGDLLGSTNYQGLTFNGFADSFIPYASIYTYAIGSTSSKLGGELRIKIKPQDSVGVSPVTIMTMNASSTNFANSVGIGTSSPQVSLSVVGNIATASSTVPSTSYANQIVCYVTVRNTLNVLGHMTQAALLSGAGSATCVAN